MNRPALVLIFLSCLFSSVPILAPSYAINGESLFTSLHCGSCHKTDEKAVGTPLKQIAGAYTSREQLVKYLKGEANPMIQWGKPAMMKGQLKKIAPLSDEEKGALADYILGFAK
jgi:cytochrome c551/c552